MSLARAMIKAALNLYLYLTALQGGTDAVIGVLGVGAEAEGQGGLGEQLQKYERRGVPEVRILYL